MNYEHTSQDLVAGSQPLKRIGGGGGRLGSISNFVKRTKIIRNKQRELDMK